MKILTDLSGEIVAIRPAIDPIYDDLTGIIVHEMDVPAGYPERMSWTGSSFTLDMAKARAPLWDAVKVRRSAEIDAGVTVPGIGDFDGDAASRENVAGATSAAMAAKAAAVPFSVTWTLRDNSRVVLDADQIIAVHLAGVARIDAIHTHAATLRALIEAAEDEAALEAIDIEEGWP